MELLCEGFEIFAIKRRREGGEERTESSNGNMGNLKGNWGKEGVRKYIGKQMEGVWLFGNGNFGEPVEEEVGF